MDYLVFLGGVILGAILANVIFRFKNASFGMLLIDHSNPDKDVYQINLDGIPDLSKKKRVMLKVNNNADLSQK